MYKQPEPMSMATALDIQSDHLNKWQSVLKPEVMAKLRDYVIASNRGVTDPYEIVRGSQIDSLVMNASYHGFLS